MDELFSPGETVDKPEYRITLTNIVEYTGTASYVPEEEDGIFLICEFEVENLSMENSKGKIQSHTNFN